MLSSFLIVVTFTICAVAFTIRPIELRNVQITGPGEFYFTNTWTSKYLQSLHGSSTESQKPIRAAITINSVLSKNSSDSTLDVNITDSATVPQTWLDYNNSTTSPEVTGYALISFWNETTTFSDLRMPYALSISYMTDHGELQAKPGYCYLLASSSDPSACDGAALYLDGGLVGSFTTVRTQSMWGTGLWSVARRR